MKNLLHKTLCGLLITLCFQARAHTLLPLQLAPAIGLPAPFLAVISHQSFLLQPIHNSSIKSDATANSINLSKKVTPFVYSECEIGELETSFVVGWITIKQRLPGAVRQKANSCLACESKKEMIYFKSGGSTSKYSMRRDHSKDAVFISHYKDRTILYAKVVC